MSTSIDLSTAYFLLTMKGAFATNSPASEKRAQEKSSRSLMLVEIAVCCRLFPIAWREKERGELDFFAQTRSDEERTSATLMNLFANRERAIGSGLDVGRGGAGDMREIMDEEVMVRGRKEEIGFGEEGSSLFGKRRALLIFLAPFFLLELYRSPRYLSCKCCLLQVKATMSVGKRSKSHPPPLIVSSFSLLPLVRLQPRLSRRTTFLSSFSYHQHVSPILSAAER